MQPCNAGRRPRNEPRRERLRAPEVVERALALASRDLEERGIAAACEAPDDVPAIQADPELLSQAVLDLVTNASEALGHGGHIAVRLRGDEDHLPLPAVGAAA